MFLMGSVALSQAPHAMIEAQQKQIETLKAGMTQLKLNSR